jgi:hypothetical protein
MRTRQPTTNTLENLRIPVQAKLAAAWTSFMFLCVYVDIIAFFKPGTIDEILVGKIWKFDVSQTLLTTFLALMAIPIFMVVLSMTLPARANRITNLIVASVQVPYTAFNMAGESWTYFYGLGFALEVIILARSCSRSHLPRCRGVGLRTVGHQLPPRRRVGAFQGPYRQFRSGCHRMRRGPPHRRHPTPSAATASSASLAPATTSRRIRSASPYRTPRSSPTMITTPTMSRKPGRASTGPSCDPVHD